MLAIVFGCGRYHTLLYGKAFTVVTDHKPLVSICQKLISSALARLQKMLLQVKGYDFTVKYRLGAEMILADGVSWQCNPEYKAKVDLDTRIYSIDIDIDSSQMCHIAMINYMSKINTDIKVDTARDHVLNALKEVTYPDWLENIKHLQNQLRMYWSYRDEITMEGDVLFVGKEVIIPESLQAGVLKNLQQAHQSIDKTRRLSRELCYWPNTTRT